MNLPKRGRRHCGAVGRRAIWGNDMKLIVAVGLALLCSPVALAQRSGVTGETPGGRTIIEREDQPAIVNYDDEDGMMNAAIDEARLRLPYFWEHMASPARGEGEFTLKVGFPVNSADGTNAEHIWVDRIRKTSAGYIARLANEPNWMEGKHLNDEVSFTEDLISDWGFSRGRKMIGFYTLRVMLPDMPQEERDAILPMLGENPK